MALVYIYISSYNKLLQSVHLVIICVIYNTSDMGASN